MTITRLFFLLATLLPFAIAHAHEDCDCGSQPVVVVAASTTPAPAAVPSAQPEKPEAPKRHPLKGVILDILAERGALLVKHEEIPGVMKAMTMLLKVDDVTLKAVQKGQTITAFLVRKTDGWYLEEVKATGQ